MAITKTPRQIEFIKIANAIVGDTLYKVRDIIKPGISATEIEVFCERNIYSFGAIPSFKGYRGFPAAICVSVNEVVIHGIPSKKIILQEGDLVGVDIGVNYKGYFGDGAYTFPVGKIDKQKKKLLAVAFKALMEAIDKAIIGNKIYHISKAIQDTAYSNGFRVVKGYSGHGVGLAVHEDPSIPNVVGARKFGPTIRPNMVLAIETMLMSGSDKIFIGKDGWSVTAKDGKPTAHFEHTILTTPQGPVILTENKPFTRDKL